jgi:hypothetical protein
MELLQGCVVTSPTVSFQVLWLKSLNAVNAKHRAIPARDNSWVKGLLPSIFSRGKPSPLVDSDVEDDV